MNQILLTENILDKDNNNGKKKSKNLVDIPSFNNNNSTSSSMDTKKIIIFFAIAIIVLGIAIISIFAARSMKNKKTNNKEGQVNKPQISITNAGDSDEDDYLAISFKSDVGIEKIVYTWDNDVPVTENVGGKKTYDVKVDIPIGATKVKIDVTDINGQTTSSEQSVLPSSSSEKPVIKPVVIEGENGKQIKLVATSNVPIKYITYKWNDEEEVRIDVEEDDETTFETIIDLKIGNNDITLTAVDINNNKGTYKSPIVTKNNPVIEVTKNDDRLYMKVSHEKGLEKIEYNVNGEIYVYDSNYANYDPELKEVEFSFALKEGENIVIITATSNEKTEEVYRGKCDYSPEEVE